MARLSFGIKTAPQHTTYDAMLKVWREADATPVFEHAWLFDHFAPIGDTDINGPCLEGWTLLAAYAAETERIRLGLMVTGNTYRHPAVLAKIAATVDVISNGRLDFGIGAGWNEYEHTSMGIPLYSPGERIRRFGEACEIARRLFTEPTVDFDGRYYQLQEARCEPKPVQKPYPPFVIGGSGEQLTLRIVARYADVWNFAGGPVETFRHKQDVLREHCNAVGRDPGEIVRSVQVRVEYDDLPGMVEAVQGYVDAGATHLVLNLRYPYPDGIVARLAEEVVPRVRAE
ncbi:MAG: LLM class F420-dependent oxidoreductase [Actinomycetota bacterium]|nr:LLM class F420-dependent oxidoreductase [Actinomycetota bacterium]